MRIFETVLTQPLDRPIGRLAKLGRSGEARSVPVTEIGERLHHFRVIERFRLDLFDDAEVDLLLGQQRKGETDGESSAAHGAHYLRSRILQRSSPVIPW